MSYGNAYTNDFVKGDEPIYNNVPNPVTTKSPLAMGHIYLFEKKSDFPPVGELGYIYIDEEADKSYKWDREGQEYVSADSKEYVKEYPNKASFPASGSSEMIYIALDKVAPYYWDGSNYQLMGSNVLFYTNRASFPATGEEDYVYIAKDSQEAYLWSIATSNYEPLVAEGKEVKGEAKVKDEYDLPSHTITIKIGSGTMVIQDSNGAVIPVYDVYRNAQGLSYVASDIGNPAREDVMYNGEAVRADKVTVSAVDALEVDLSDVMGTNTLLYEDDTFSINR